MNTNSSNRVPEVVVQLCDEGDTLVTVGDAKAAYAKFAEAWELVPEDKARWAVSTRILRSLGEIQFQRNRWPEALNLYLRAVQGPGGLGDPKIHLRIGQCQFELGDYDRAADELTRAFMAGGPEIFSDGAKYFAFLQTRIQPPVGGW